MAVFGMVNCAERILLPSVVKDFELVYGALFQFGLRLLNCGGPCDFSGRRCHNSWLVRLEAILLETHVQGRCRLFLLFFDPFRNYWRLFLERWNLFILRSCKFSGLKLDGSINLHGRQLLFILPIFDHVKISLGVLVIGTTIEFTFYHGFSLGVVLWSVNGEG